MRRFSFLGIACAILVLSTSFASHSPTSTFEITITNIRSTQGEFVLGFYKDNKSFSKREPFMNKTIKKTKLKDGVVRYRMSLPTGTYGIALLDDENNNGKVDYGFLLPKEGFGFSDYYHRGLTAPSFDKFAFDLPTGGTTVKIKVKYM